MHKTNSYFLSLIILSFYAFSSLKSYLKDFASEETLSNESFSFHSEKDSFKLHHEPLSGFEAELYVLLKKREESQALKLSKRDSAIRKVIYKVSDETKTPAELIEAICRVESNFDPHAFRGHDGGRSNHAIGLCQVLRRTGEMVMNHQDKGCRKDYRRVPKSKRDKNACFLFDTYANVKAAALYLRKQMDQHNSLEKVIAAYNAGSVRVRRKTGDFVNRRYVNKVLTALQNYGSSVRAGRNQDYLLTSN